MLRGAEPGRERSANTSETSAHQSTSFALLACEAHLCVIGCQLRDSEFRTSGTRLREVSLRFKRARACGLSDHEHGRGSAA